MRRLVIALGVAGALGLGAAKGAAWGLGLLLGAALSYLSFVVTERFVRSLSPASQSRPAAWRAVLLGSRYLILGALVYAMIKLFGVSPIAILCGLLTLGAAAIIEILYELFTWNMKS